LLDLRCKNLLPPALSDPRLSIVRAIDPQITSIGTKEQQQGNLLIHRKDDYSKKTGFMGLTCLNQPDPVSLLGYFSVLMIVPMVKVLT